MPGAALCQRRSRQTAGIRRLGHRRWSGDRNRHATALGTTAAADWSDGSGSGGAREHALSHLGGTTAITLNGDRCGWVKQRRASARWWWAMPGSASHGAGVQPTRPYPAADWACSGSGVGSPCCPIRPLAVGGVGCRPRGGVELRPLSKPIVVRGSVRPMPTWQTSLSVGGSSRAERPCSGSEPCLCPLCGKAGLCRER